MYTGCLACRLSASDLNFKDMYRNHTGIPISPTFQTGSIPIDGIFASPGIECINIFLLPHLGGVGDHRCFIIDFSSNSMIGTLFPNIVRCASRKLHCSSKRMINLYNAEITSKCDEHNMFHSMDEILQLTDYLGEEDFVLLMNPGMRNSCSLCCTQKMK